MSTDGNDYKNTGGTMSVAHTTSATTPRSKGTLLELQFLGLECCCLAIRSCCLYNHLVRPPLSGGEGVRW